MNRNQYVAFGIKQEEGVASWIMDKLPEGTEVEIPDNQFSKHDRVFKLGDNSVRLEIECHGPNQEGMARKWEAGKGTRGLGWLSIPSRRLVNPTWDVYIKMSPHSKDHFYFLTGQDVLRELGGTPVTYRNSASLKDEPHRDYFYKLTWDKIEDELGSRIIIDDVPAMINVITNKLQEK